MKSTIREKRSFNLRQPNSVKMADDFTQFAGDPDFVLSIARGLKVIESFSGNIHGVTPAEVAADTGLSRAVVRRFLLTLERLGYAESDSRTYRLTMTALRLGFSYLSSSSLAVSAQPVLNRITETVDESSSMTALDGDQIVYLARATTSRVMSIALSVGSRLPAYCTSMGRVMLASLPSKEITAYLRRIRPMRLTPRTVMNKAQLAKFISQAHKDGYSIVDEELELGLRSIAVPVRNRQNRVVAAINIGANARRVDRKQLESFLPILREGAIALTQSLG